MRRWTHRMRSGSTNLGLLAFGTAVAILVVNAVGPHLRAQQKGPQPSKAQTLTAVDYIEIRQLVARYGYAVDTGADNGNMYADLFAPDGAFLDRTGKATTGRDALAAVARRFQRGPQSQFHFMMNHVIEATPGGARGKQYLLQLRMGEPDHENDIFGGGHYEDTYEKTAKGWRFKTRQFVPSDLLAAGTAPAPSVHVPLSATPLGAAASSGSSASTLSVLDYLQIQQLAYRYGWALDSGADNGFAYADLYTPDGIFTGTNQGPAGRSYQGRDKLAALARGGLRGPLYVSHYATNVVVEPAPDGGATGHTYVAIFKLGADGKPSVIEHGGRYDDVYQKTADGWRFKHRTYYDSKSGDPVQPPPVALAPLVPLTGTAGKKQSTPAKVPASGSPALTAEDYIGIQDLVARYPFALDGDVDGGTSYANLFTPDAVFRQPLTEGREKLSALAMAQPHGPEYARHFITNHVIDAAAGGATGKEYLVVVDIDAPGKPGKVFLVGHYDDTYAKTADGWRFKTRTFVTARPGTPAAQ
jgi:SnoaL-like domain